jgi:lipopolysaccharide biosynthesis protein
MLEIKIGTILQIFKCLWLSKENKKYLKTIKYSNVFNSNYYILKRPRNIATQLLPLSHYVIFGENQGLWPNPNFSPSAYLANNPELADEIQHPLWHYLTVGKALQLRAMPFPQDRSTLPADLAAIPSAPNLHTLGIQSDLAIVVHVFHYELWEEIAAALRHIPQSFDLYCTVIRREGYDPLVADIQARFPNARVLCFPNHGRDIFPFVHLVNSGIFSNYAAVCKLHTKKSVHLEDGDRWRSELIQGILPSSVQIRAFLDAFLAEPNIGAVVSDSNLMAHPHLWGVNRPRVTDELGRVGIAADRYKLSFPGGSMYWIKPEALGLLQSMNFCAEDFEREEGQLDGTLAHAIERIMGFLVQHAGQRVCGVSELLTETECQRRHQSSQSTFLP